MFKKIMVEREEEYRFCDLCKKAITKRTITGGDIETDASSINIKDKEYDFHFDCLLKEFTK